MKPILRSTLWLLAAGVCAGTAVPGSLRAQDDPAVLEKLRRDQDEILRKAERMRALMERLMQRYEREGKQDQIKLLQEGIAHLDRSGLLRTVAGIRDDLAATALSEALRKQEQVVDQLERLLNILLERSSVENLDQAMQTAAEQAATAAELALRQKALQEQTQRALRGEPSEAERRLQESLRNLADQQRAEAERNAMESGSRRPFLENALQRIESLLKQQERVERALQDDTGAAANANRQRQFDLGEVVQRARELTAQLREEARQGEMQQAADALKQAAQGSDEAALQAARERFDRMLQDAPKLAGGAEGPERDPKWSELRKQLEAAPANGEAQREPMAKLGEQGEQLAQQRAEQARQRNTADAKRLQQAADRLADAMEAAAKEAPQTGEPPQGG
ncbi:MAG: hypothetical protein RL398_1135, partial [Planctomycetota bacterium]